MYFLLKKLKVINLYLPLSYLVFKSIVAQFIFLNRIPSPTTIATHQSITTSPLFFPQSFVHLVIRTTILSSKKIESQSSHCWPLLNIITVLYLL